MRTTINIDDDVLNRLREYATSRDLALGQAASDVIRRGLIAPVEMNEVNGFPVVVLPAGSPVVTIEEIERLQDEGE